MAFTDHKLKFTIDADGKGAKRELSDIDRLIGKIGKSGGMGDVFGGNLAAQAVSKLSSALVSGGQTILDYSARMEQTKIGFTTLMGSAQAATQHLKDLQKFALSTPFEFQDLTTASRRLQNVGLEAQKVIPVMEDIGNAAAAAGASSAELDSISLAFSQIIAKGKLSAEEVNQLAERGIPVWKMLEEQLGKSKGEIIKLAEQGKISSEVFLDAFQRFSQANFGGAMKAQSKTFLGAMSTIKDSALQAADEGLKPLYDELVRIANRMAEGQGEAQKWGQSTNHALQDVIDGLHGANNAASTPGGLWDWMKWGLDKFDEHLRQTDGLAKSYADWAESMREAGAQARNLQKGMLNLENFTYNPGGAATVGAPAVFGTSTWGHGRRKAPPISLGSGVGATRRAASTSDDRTDKQVYQDFVGELKKLGVTINSGFRTYAQQAALFARLPKGQAARPGTSDHEFYKAVDLPPNVSRTILEKAARAAGVTLDKANVHEGTGRHNHQGFQKGKYTGGGETDAYEEAVAAREELAEWDRLEREGLRELADEWIAAEGKASESRLSIRQKEAEQEQVIIEGMVISGEMTEREAVQRVGQLRLDMLKEEQQELQGQIPTEQNLQRLEELRLEIGTQSLENINEELEYWKKVTTEINKQNAGLEKRNQRPSTLRTRRPGEDTVMGGTGIGGAIGQGMGVELVPMFDEATGAMLTFQDRLAMVGSDINNFVGQAIGGMIDGLAQMGAAWLVTGEFSAKAALQMAAGAALGIAMQAGVKAIFEFAEAAAAAATGNFYGAAMHTAAAHLYVKTAIVAGAIGVGLGLAGRAVGGGTGSGSGSGRAGSSSQSSSNNQQQQPRPYSRQSDDAYISGNRGDNAISNLAAEIRRLREMVSTASPGDVLVAGARQKRGFIGTQAADDMKRNPSLGSTMLRRSGAR